MPQFLFTRLFGTPTWIWLPFFGIAAALLKLNLGLLQRKEPTLDAPSDGSNIGGQYTDERIAPMIAQAIIRLDDGRLAIRQTPELLSMHKAAKRRSLARRADQSLRGVQATGFVSSGHSWQLN